MVQFEQIAVPSKEDFGFFSTVPILGANSRFRRKVKRILASREPFEETIETMWSACPYPAQDIQAIRDCIRKNIGWPNSLFLPDDSFLALAPLEIDRYDSFTADTDTVNDIYFILNPNEKESIQSDKTVGGRLVHSLVRNGDIPLMDTSFIASEHTLLDVLQMITSEKTADQ